MKSFHGLLLLAIFLSCAYDDQKLRIPTIDLSQPWEFSTPRQQSIDDLSSEIIYAKSLDRLTSLTIVRNGKMVVQECFNGYKADSLHDVRSVTKSVLSFLVGLAIEKNFINSADDKISAYLKPPEYDLTDDQKQIRISDLLNMTSGFEWNELNGDSYSQWIDSKQPINFLLQQPQAHGPGEVFDYNSAAVHLLSVVLSKAVNKSLPEIARDFLFERIGIEKIEWEQFPDGSVNGASGIKLRPEDLARVGQLILQKGASGKNQIVSGEWIKSMCSPQFNWRTNFGSLLNFTYGRLWWIQDNLSSERNVIAWGYGGQFIFVVPNKMLVIIVTSNWLNLQSNEGYKKAEQAALSLIIDRILPKVH